MLDIRWTATIVATVLAAGVAYWIWRPRRKEAPGVALQFERVSESPTSSDRYVLRVTNNCSMPMQFSHDLILNVDLKGSIKRLMPATNATKPFELAAGGNFQYEIAVDEMAKAFRNVSASGVFDVCCLIFDTTGKKYKSPFPPVSTIEMAARWDAIARLSSGESSVNVMQSFADVEW